MVEVMIMGILDKAKSLVSGGGDSKSEDIAEGFEEEFDEESVEIEGEEDEVEEEMVEEWDSAYQFSDEALKELGFDGVSEFADKAMVSRIERSPLYRDRIESGIRTMNQITDSMTRIQEVRKELGADGSVDYSEYAEQVRGANNLINEIDRLSGREEQMANEIIGVAKDAVNAYATQSRNRREVNSTMGVSEEEF